MNLPESITSENSYKRLMAINKNAIDNNNHEILYFVRLIRLIAIAAATNCKRTEIKSAILIYTSVRLKSN